MSEVENYQYRNYPSNELIFNAEQTKAILNYFYPTNKSSENLGVDFIEYAAYPARNLAQNMLIEAVKKSNDMSYIRQRFNDFKTSPSLYEHPELKEVSMRAIKEKSLLFKNSKINHIKDIKIYISAKKSVATDSKQRFKLLSRNNSERIDQKKTIQSEPLANKSGMGNNINLPLPSAESQSLFNQVGKHCRHQAQQMKINWSEDEISNTTYALTHAAMQNRFKNVTNLSFSDNCQIINIADLSSDNCLYASINSNDASKISKQESLQNIAVLEKNIVEQATQQNQQHEQQKSQKH